MIGRKPEMKRTTRNGRAWQAMVACFCAGSAMEVRINGFELHEADGGSNGARSLFLGPFVKNGTNEITWSARIAPTALATGQPAWAQIEVMAAPVDAVRTPAEPGETLFERRVVPAASYTLLPVSGEGPEILDGEISQDDGAAVFRQIAPRRWAWGMRIIDPTARFSGRPMLMNFARISESLVLGEVHFLLSGTDRHLVFQNVRMPRGGGEIAFTDDMVARGRRFLDEGEFDTIWIFGSSAEGVEAVSLAMLDLNLVQAKFEERTEFEVTTPDRWAWERAEELGPLDQHPEARAEVVDFLRRLHGTMNSEPPASWVPYFETKASDLAKSMGKPATEVSAQQIEFFHGLAGIEGWGLEPFDEKRLLLHPVNSRVLRVRYVDSEGPIQSLPLPKPDDPATLDRFTMPLYLAKVDGKWTVIR
jgi:hypothetical protein